MNLNYDTLMSLNLTHASWMSYKYFFVKSAHVDGVSKFLPGRDPRDISWCQLNNSIVKSNKCMNLWDSLKMKKWFWGFYRDTTIEKRCSEGRWPGLWSRTELVVSCTKMNFFVWKPFSPTHCTVIHARRVFSTMYRYIHQMQRKWYIHFNFARLRDWRCVVNS